MGIVIQKFGGTSVATPAVRAHVLERIAAVGEKGNSSVVVVSAMGRSGDPYATDTLIGLLTQESNRVSPRELDLLISCGEVISCAVLSQALEERGYASRSFTGSQAGIVTNNDFGNARILEIDTTRIMDAVNEGVVPVVAGFQGVTRNGETTTLGRGGSDTTAAALGVALGAERVEIYTDVNGVKTADPRLVPDAVTLERLTYREVVEMAHLGAKVIHPRAVEIAMEGRMPLLIRSVDSDSGGTIVSDGRRTGQLESITSDKVVTGIAHVSGRAHVVIETIDDFNEEARGLMIFEKLAESDVSVDMIYVSPGRIGFIVGESKTEEVERVLEEMGLEYHCHRGFAKVSVVGAGMHGVPGVMARVLSALQAGKVPVYQTTDSHANISCLVREENVESALRRLHHEFELSQDPNQGSDDDDHLRKTLDRDGYAYEGRPVG